MQYEAGLFHGQYVFTFHGKILSDEGSNLNQIFLEGNGSMKHFLDILNEKDQQFLPVTEVLSLSQSAVAIVK